MDNTQAICFGEILWDIFPDRQVIGGAPLNVALRLSSYGTKTQIISRIGRDELGDGILAYLLQKDVSQELIQQDQNLPTGAVLVSLDNNGSASYEISKPVAWDVIALTSQLITQVKQAPYFIFGSLAIRGETNRQTLNALLQVANTKIFDVNLRPPHYHISMVYELMQVADMIKLNEEELTEISEKLGCQDTSIEDRMHWLMRVTETKIICTTLGADGAVLLYNDKIYRQKGFQVKVKDTVGSGDSFLATLVQELLLSKKSPQESLTLACAVGALVASKEGANCSILDKEIEQLIKFQNY